MMEAHEFERSDAGFGWIINHLPTILWQRKYYVLGVFGVLALAAAIAATFVALRILSITSDIGFDRRSDA